MLRTEKRLRGPFQRFAPRSNTLASPLDSNCPPVRAPVRIRRSNRVFEMARAGERVGLRAIRIARSLNYCKKVTIVLVFRMFLRTPRSSRFSQRIPISPAGCRPHSEPARNNDCVPHSQPAGITSSGLHPRQPGNNWTQLPQNEHLRERWAANPFRMRTYKDVVRKPPRMNTYKKVGGGGT